MENYRELIEEKLDNVILQHSYSRNREKRVGSEYVEFVDWLVKELDKAREEGYKKGYIDGQIEKINKPKPVVSEFDKTSYLN